MNHLSRVHRQSSYTWKVQLMRIVVGKGVEVLRAQNPFKLINYSLTQTSLAH